MRTAIVRFAAIFALVAGALVFGTATSAAPGNGNGASVVNVPQTCYSDGSYTYCYSEKSVLNDVMTPSGNENIVDNGTVCVTMTDSATGIVSSGDCDKYVGHILTKDGTTQENSYKSIATITFFGTTSCFTIYYHEANGRIQFSNGGVTPGAC
jgi:hypothetical protein